MSQDPDERQRLLDEPGSGDDLPIAVSAYQAQKCAAIIEAALHGQIGYDAPAQTALQFLRHAASEAALGLGRIHPTSSSLWTSLREVPWPPPGGPRPQPDVSE
ncbi:hypothetical protein CLV35_0234 [Motilibacter peucedani]|uniref:Uncharacterized protein n=1 Tax=Motilibacter peucedani TaxID=598650 RepID=A0A420XUX9_9ACTN|nr:hypothetical protein [Motilibacter peucedani]RKS80645.1 hypothetical protein CLV35_0234 [Motilibacter peucedani]